MKDINNLLSDALQQNALTLDHKAQHQLVHYLDLLQTWNRVYNLTNITTPREMVYLHIIDSLMVQPYLYGTRLLDVGTGAGLPGIPLAIINPHQQWTLLDKNSKKTRFLIQAVAELRLTNVRVLHSRCEDFSPLHYFDSILSRAFGTLRLFMESTEHLLSEKGVFIAMKGKYPQDEIADVPARFLLKNGSHLTIKGITIERHVVCFNKKC